MSRRIENKYQLSKSEFLLLQSKLKLLGMEEIFPERLVKSCYFDTNNLTLFNQSEEGILPRKKLRIRWYNNLLKFQKELKISSVEGRFKTTEILHEISNIREVFDLRIVEPDYGILVPKVVISYRRNYYKFHNLRITFDHTINFENPVLDNTFCVPEPYCVMEVKAPVSTGEAYIQKLIPLSTSRFSKYCRGIIAIGR